MNIKGKKILKSATTAVEGYIPVKTLSNKLERVVNAGYKWIKTRKEIEGPPEMSDVHKLTKISFVKKIIVATQLLDKVSNECEIGTYKLIKQ